jgi:UPF0755 protein
MLKTFVIVACFFAACTGAAVYYLDWAAMTPLDASAPEAIVFDVPKGTTLGQVGRDLVAAGLVRNELAFRLWIKLHPDAPRPKAGKHAISRAMNVPQQLLALAAQPISEDVRLTMLEGWRLRDSDAFLAGRGLCAPGAYLQAASAMQRFKLPFEVEGSDLSGYLFPETYMIPPGKFDVDGLIQRQIDAFNQRFVLPHRAEIDASKRGLRTLVIMASLLEREEPRPELRAQVAGVLYNRLDRPMPLGVDATSRFKLDDWNDRDAFLKMLRDVDDPYNTRHRTGLPPGPIGSPGLASLLAALRPEPTPYWYYLHDKSAVIHFARTLQEHEANRRKYDVW